MHTLFAGCSIFLFANFNIQKGEPRDRSGQDKNSAPSPNLPFSIGHSFFPIGDTIIAPAKRISRPRSANGGFQAMKSGLEFPAGAPGNPRSPGY